MPLGTLMRQLRNEAAAEELLLSFADLLLLAEVDEMRNTFGESVGEYVAGATQRFAASAGSEDWLQLMTRLEKSDAPAAACLETMLRWAVKTDRADLAPRPPRRLAAVVAMVKAMATRPEAQPRSARSHRPADAQRS